MAGLPEEAVLGYASQKLSIDNPSLDQALQVHCTKMVGMGHVASGNTVQVLQSQSRVRNVPGYGGGIIEREPDQVVFEMKARRFSKFLFQVKKFVAVAT